MNKLSERILCRIDVPANAHAEEEEEGLSGSVLWMPGSSPALESRARSYTHESFLSPKMDFDLLSEDDGSIVFHPTVQRLLDVRATRNHTLMVFEHHRLSLLDRMKYSAHSISHSWRLFMIFQLLEVIHFMHQSGLAHGSLAPSKLHVIDSAWMVVSNEFLWFDGIEMEEVAPPWESWRKEEEHSTSSIVFHVVIVFVRLSFFYFAFHSV